MQLALQHSEDLDGTLRFVALSTLSLAGLTANDHHPCIWPDCHTPSSCSTFLAQHSSPYKVKDSSCYPDTNQNGSLNGGKYRASDHNKPANKSKEDRNQDEWFHWPFQLWLAEPQDDSSKHGQEEERVLRKPIQCQQDAHVAKQNIR